jgi:hypothetical protein
MKEKRMSFFFFFFKMLFIPLGNAIHLILEEYVFFFVKK